MLPDYPKVKALITEAFHKRLALAKERRLGAFSQVRRSTLHEGSSLDLTRYDNSSETVGMYHIEASAEVRHEEQEADGFGFDAIMRMADRLGEKLAAEQVKVMLERVGDAVRQVGNVADPSLPMMEQLFDSWNKILIEFTPDGTPIMPTFVMGSETAVEKMKEVLQQIESDPSLRRRFDEIIERKRHEWRDREAARNLVE